MKAKTISDVRGGYLLGILSGMTWGLDTVLIGVIMSIAPFTTSALLLVSGVFVCSFFHDAFAAMWMTLLLTYKKRIQLLVSKVKTRDGLFCALGAILGGPIGMSFYMLAIKNAGPAYTATITSSYPALGVALAVVFLKEKLSMKGWFGLLVCISGIIWLSYEPVESALSPSVYMGILFAIVSAFGWALESVVCAYGMKSGNVTPEMALTIRELSSFVTYGCLIVPLFCGGYHGVIEVITSNAMFWLLLTALIGVTSYLAWYKSIDTIGASRAISLNVTYSFWTILFSVLLFGGTFSIKMLICSLLIIGGVTLAVGKPKNVLKMVINE
ncbi:DMT family transporter [Bacteroides fragilis]|uniref:DMT family transporter n=1 Tax=Bacteroides TaxID=816 RepID=UPI002030997D|nr:MULTISPECIES: DMT family transporter [Bacteroides]MCM0323226.1 DMT family transporter [Bacteroides fragilis]MCZ2614373.1 DMT family transporter [Bacteroides fragilis]MCZ2625164.1 DMT family transporter [Bacteroides fragilis]MDV6187508.1 DMT family transporter [Bacteroides hominis (ex Liu et al. 2022)]